MCTRVSSTDCKTEDGITVGLIDAVIAICGVLSVRLHEAGNPGPFPVAVQEALRDLHSHDHVWAVLETAAYAMKDPRCSCYSRGWDVVTAGCPIHGQH